MHNILNIKIKFFISLLLAFSWSFFSILLSYKWFHDLSLIVGVYFSIYLIGFIAIVPGFINSFQYFSLLFDQRPQFIKVDHFPDVTVLIAAYNEEKTIQKTILSLQKQDYPSVIHIIVIDDGSKDATVNKISELQKDCSYLHLSQMPSNQGKANALNQGLKEVTTSLVITIDADCLLLANSIKNIVSRYLSDPPNTKAVAGTILVSNSRDNWITKAQEWDYLIGIGAIKRIQSMYQGTLVAQGAFSIYDTNTLNQLGGWPNMVGEDIVLTWKMLNKGYRIGHAENACVFTVCPNTIYKFIKQRQRWSRGLIEAFKHNPQLIYKPRLSTIYIWLNFLFPFIDLAYTVGFLPGMILALFGKFWIVGPMTLILIPQAILLNSLMYIRVKKMFLLQGLKIRKNIFGFLFYLLPYGLILQPACVYGYFSEFFGIKKTWGTK